MVNVSLVVGMRDYYDTLDVSRDASPEQIRAAYRFHIKAFHPDKFTAGTDDALNGQRRIAEIVTAYGVLSKPESRSEYDRFRKYTSERSSGKEQGRRFLNELLARWKAVIATVISRAEHRVSVPIWVPILVVLFILAIGAWLIQKRQPHVLDAKAPSSITPLATDTTALPTEPTAARPSPSEASTQSQAPPPDSVTSNAPNLSTEITTVGVPHESSTDFTKYATQLREQARLNAQAQIFVPSTTARSMTRFAWKTNIVTTVSWIGESGNTRSAWDANWTANYGGADTPDPAARQNYIPVSFVPRQNPFYCGLPYNDVTHGQFRPEAPLVIPWFKHSYTEPGRSVCKDRWLAIRKGNRTCYAQWEDCGPFRTDDFQYVFQNERPKPNANRGAGLNVSPAVRDYLGLAPIDVTDWQFSEVRDVPPGPWRNYGDNNHFVIAKRQSEQSLSPEESTDSGTSPADHRSEAARQRDFETSRELHVAWELEQKKDYRNAAKLYRDLASQGNSDAQTNLAKLYLRGKGVQRDDNKAKYLLKQAAVKGDEEAQRILSALSAQDEARKRR